MTRTSWPGMMSRVNVREIDRHDPAEPELVAVRMRETLEEVLGREAGRAMYTLDWLRQRVLWHLDGHLPGQVFVSVDERARLTGHTIVRVDTDDSGDPVGLFSTTFVAPEFRRRGVALKLLRRGEDWMRGQSLQVAVTWTAEDNAKLIGLFLRAGYAVSDRQKGFVKLARCLARQGPEATRELRRPTPDPPHPVEAGHQPRAPVLAHPEPPGLDLEPGHPGVRDQLAGLDLQGAPGQVGNPRR
ncbi:MAG: GNAT family N-acetyltransferase [Candidatus Eremiobacterota bacterium]